MKSFLLMLLSAMIAGAPAIAEEFTWSWDEDAGKAESSAVAGPTVDMTVDTTVKNEGVATAGANEAAAATAPKETAEPTSPIQASEQPAVVPETVAPATPAKKSPFAWSWEEGEDVSVAKEESGGKEETAAQSAVISEPMSEPAPVAKETERHSVPVAAPVETKGATRIASGEYDDLVKENLELRGKVDNADRQKESLAKENENLSRQVQDLTKKIEDAVERIKEIKKGQPSTAEGERAVEFEAKLNSVEAEKNKLAAELAAMRNKPADMTAAAKTEGGTVRAGSDLYRQLEKENTALKDELSRLESDRSNLGKLQQEMLTKIESARREVEQADMRQRELKERLAEAKASERESKKSVSKILENLPAMERDLVGLKSAVVEKDAALQGSHKDIAELKEELQRRERRLQKAEKMAEMLDKARSDVSRVSNKEKRDMHYNMAVVYAKEGKYQEAEREYLRALQIDPTDPDAHYNLGVLYDNDLRNKAKAALHYRAYLKLNPYAKDADAVRQWLMEMDIKSS